MTRRHMRIFTTLYENNGNMTKTAEQLYIAQPGVSLALAELEDYYQVKLFDRISRKLYITEMGKKFYHYAKGICDMFEDVELAMKHQEDIMGLRIGCCDSIDACLLPKYISAFYQLHPGVTVKSYVDSAEALEMQIDKNKLDFAIVDRPVQNSKIVFKNFIADNIGFGISPQSGYFDGDKMKLEELMKCPLLVRKRGCGARDIMERVVENRGYHLEPVLESASAIYVLNAALQGMGIAVLPEKVLEYYRKKGRLHLITITDADFKMIYGLIYHKDKALSKISVDFLQMCQVFPDTIAV